MQGRVRGAARSSRRSLPAADAASYLCTGHAFSTGATPMTAPAKILLQTTIPTTDDDWSIERFGLSAGLPRPAARRGWRAAVRGDRQGPRTAGRRRSRALDAGWVGLPGALAVRRRHRGRAHQRRLLGDHALSPARWRPDGHPRPHGPRMLGLRPRRRRRRAPLSHQEPRSGRAPPSHRRSRSPRRSCGPTSIRAPTATSRPSPRPDPCTRF